MKISYRLRDHRIMTRETADAIAAHPDNKALFAVIFMGDNQTCRYILGHRITYIKRFGRAKL